MTRHPPLSLAGALPRLRRISVATKRWIVCGAVAMLVPSGASAACQGAWDLSGSWRFGQSNGLAAYFDLQQTGNVITGTGKYSTPGTGGGFDSTFGLAATGSVNGSINGGSFRFTANWGGTLGEYTGVINDQGKIGGTTYNKNNPGAEGGAASWQGNRAANCKAASAEIPPAKALGRVKLPSTTAAPVSICESARNARARNSPAAPGLEAQCQAFLAAQVQQTAPKGGSGVGEILKAGLQPDLAVAGIEGPAKLQAGLSGTFKVTIKNTGTAGATVELAVIFAGKLDQTGQIVAGAGLACAVAHDAGINAAVRCTGGQLAGGATATIVVQGRGQQAGAGMLVATLNASRSVTESSYDNNLKQLNLTIN